jgi:2',5'-phosphodiesterase
VLYCRLRVVTYNILADLYADSDTARDILHPYCPPYALAIDYRKQLITKELMG